MEGFCGLGMELSAIVDWVSLNSDLVFLLVGLVSLGLTMWCLQPPSVSSLPIDKQPGSRLRDVKMREKPVVVAKQEPVQEPTETAAEMPAKKADVAKIPHREGLIVAYVMPKKGADVFRGYRLMQILAQNDLHATEQQHFQRFAKPQGQGKLWFHVASMRHPGTFDLADPGSMTCPGLALILDCRQVEHVMHAFDCLVETAHQLARDLDAEVLDENKEILGTHTMLQWRQVVSKYAMRAETADVE